MNKEAVFTAHAEADQSDSWRTESRDRIEVGIPPEFDGSYEGFAPENLYALSLTNCFIATFQAIAERSGLGFDSIMADGELQVGDKDGDTVMKKMDLEIVLRGAEDDEKAELLLGKTERNCWILNSVDTEIRTSFELQS